MTENGRFIPPSKRRLAAAATQGIVPRSSTFTAGVALLATAGFGYALAGPLFDAMTALFAFTLDAAVGKQRSLTDACTGALTVVWPIGVALVVAPLLGAILGTYFPVRSLGLSPGKTAVPIPKIRPPRFEIAVVRLLGLLVFGAAAFYLLRHLTFEGHRLLAGIGRLLLYLAAILGGILMLVGWHEISARRRTIFQALMLNRSEAGREARAQSRAATARRPRARDGEDRR